MVVATDGGATAHVGEVEAVFRTLTSVVEALAAGTGSACGRELVVVYDCQAVVQMLCSPSAPRHHFYQWRATRLALRRCAELGVELAWHWVPSHGKSSRRWRPLLGLGESEVRSCNAAADAAVTRQLATTRLSAPRAAWCRHVRALVDWAALALSLAYRVAALYRAHLNALEDRLPLAQLLAGPARAPPRAAPYARRAL
jgi:hypothetical protein